MNLPHPGELRHKVSIGKTENAVNANGYPEATDTVVCRVWAGIMDDASSRYFGASGAENAQRGLCFMIRWRNDVRTGMWVMWNDEKQLITEVGEYDFKRRYMKLVTQSVKGVN